LLLLVDHVSAITSFDLWMFKGAHNVFALIVKSLVANWVSRHITIGSFEAFKILS
jgi:hypothetical protein